MGTDIKDIQYIVVRRGNWVMLLPVFLEVVSQTDRGDKKKCRRIEKKQGASLVVTVQTWINKKNVIRLSGTSGHSFEDFYHLSIVMPAMQYPSFSLFTIIYSAARGRFIVGR